MSEQKEQPKQELVKKPEESIVESVINRVNVFHQNGDMKLPANYSVENAVRSAWLIIQETQDMNKKPALEVCTRESVVTALFDMVLQGLSPIKKQCYFIVYGNKLQMTKSYIGTIAVAKRFANVKEATANVVFEGDEFEYEIDALKGRKKIVKHTQLLENIDPDKIRGAYATIEYNDGTTDSEIMTIKQIRQAWAQRKGQGESPAHKNFPDQMAMKTVIQRALKVKIGATDDSALFEEDEITEDAAVATVQHEIKTNANKQAVGFESPKKVAAPFQQATLRKEEIRMPPQQEAEPVVSESETAQPGF